MGGRGDRHGDPERFRRVIRVYAALAIWLLVSLAAPTAHASPAAGTQQLSPREASPPVYGAYPTGGPVHGGTAVTIAGAEFGINGFVNDARCSWGDPRAWQQAVFSRQQASLEGWRDDEQELPPVPPAYFTTPYDLREGVPVDDELRAAFDLPDDLLEVRPAASRSHIVPAAPRA